MLDFNDFRQKIENVLASGKLGALDFRGIEPETAISGLLDCVRSRDSNVVQNASKVMKAISNSSKVPRQYIEHMKEFDSVMGLMGRARKMGLPTDDVEDVIGRASKAYGMKDHGSALNLVNKAKGMLRNKLHTSGQGSQMGMGDGFAPGFGPGFAGRNMNSGFDDMNDDFDDFDDLPDPDFGDGGADLDGDGFADRLGFGQPSNAPVRQPMGMGMPMGMGQEPQMTEFDRQMQNQALGIFSLGNKMVEDTFKAAQQGVYSMEGNVNYGNMNVHPQTVGSGTSGAKGTVIERWGYTIGMPVKVTATGRVGERDVIVAGAGNAVLMFSEAGKLLWRYPVNGSVQSLRIGNLSGKDVIIVGTDSDIYVLSSVVDSYTRIDRLTEKLGLSGGNVRPVRDMLHKAEEAAQRGEHDMAAKLIGTAESAVNEMNDQYESATNLIGKVANLVTHPRVAKSEAEELLGKAKETLHLGNFLGAQDLAKKAEQKAKHLLGLD